MAGSLFYNTGEKIKRHPKLIWIIIILLLILAIFTFIPPLIVNWQIKKQLKEQGEDQVKIEYVTFNPFLFRFRINSLFAESANKGVMQWKKMSFEINVWPLRKKRLYIKDFILNNAKVTLQHSGSGEWIFGGIRFRTGGRSHAGKKEKKAWEFGVSKVNLTNVQVTYVDSLLKQSILITHGQVDSFISWKPANHTHFKLRSIINSGTIKVSGSADPQGKNRSISIHASVDSLPLHWLEPVLARHGFNGFKGTVDAKYYIHGVSRPVTKTALNASGKLTLSNFQSRIPSLPFLISVSKITVNGDNSYLGGNRANITNSISISNAICKDISQKIILLSFNNAAMKLASSGLFANVNIENLNFKNINALGSYKPENSQKDSPFAVKMNAFSIDTASITDSSGFHFGKTVIQKLKLALIKSYNGDFMYYHILSSYFKKSGKTTPSKTKPLKVKINELFINDSSTILFKDISTNPDVNITANNADVTISNFIIGEETPGNFKINADIEPFASFHAEGTFRSFSPELTITLNSGLNEFELIKISPYLKDLFGYNFKSGHLNATLEGNIRSNKLNLNNTITLREVTVTPIDTAAAFKKFRNIFLGVSLETALNILIDNSGNVQLNIPVSGDLSDPDFNILDVIRTATFNNLKGGIAGQIGNVFSPRHKPPFRPVIFQIQSVNITSKDSNYLDSLSGRILKHPDYPINLCGITAITEFNKSLTNHKSLNGEQKNRLLNLAQKRSTVVKEFLIQKKVPSSQLFLCAPQIDDSKDAVPRVDIRLGFKSIEQR